jgi:RNA-binding protein YhbY
LAEIRRQLEARKPVKVRFLRGAGMDPEDLAARTGGKILGVRGRTVVIVKGK